MQKITFRDYEGSIKSVSETFMVPEEPSARESVLKKRYEQALKTVFANGGELIGISQRKIGRNDPCPCGSARKFKKCCEGKMNIAMNSGSS